MQTPDGSPIDGFTRGNCDTINGNAIRKTVTFNGSADLSALAGQPVRMRVETYDTKIYAFQFK